MSLFDFLYFLDWHKCDKVYEELSQLEGAQAIEILQRPLDDDQNR